jgi:hypothetical protein
MKTLSFIGILAAGEFEMVFGHAEEEPWIVGLTARTAVRSVAE